MLKLMLEYLVFSKKTLIISVVFVLSLIMCESSLTFASELDVSNTITVTAIIEPERHIVVNQNNKIIEVLTNTPLMVIPVVSLNSLSGNQLEYSTAISTQYQQIISSCNFTKSYGIIYSSGNCNGNSVKIVATKSMLSSLVSTVEADSLALIMGHRIL